MFDTKECIFGLKNAFSRQTRTSENCLAKFTARAPLPPGRWQPSPAALDALGIGFSELAAAIKEKAGSTKASQQTQVFPAEARGIASIDVQWDKLANGSCTDRLRYARKIVGDIVSVCGSIMPATTEPEDEQAAVPENSRGVEIGLTWSESALEEAQLWARMMRTGNNHALAPLVRWSAAEASLEG